MIFCRFLRYRMIQEHRAVLSKPGTRSYSIVLGSSQAGQHGQTKSWWPPFQYNPICFWYDHLNNPPLINFQYARHEWHIHIHLKNFLTSSGSEEYHPRQTQRRESLVERALRICPQKTAGLGKVQVTKGPKVDRGFFHGNKAMTKYQNWSLRSGY